MQEITKVRHIVMTAQQICAKHDLSPVYVKRALQRGWLLGHKVLMPGTKVMQWVVEVEEVDRWRKACAMHKTPKGSFSGSARDLRGLQEWLESAKEEDLAKLKASLAGRKIG
jgi:hypothetical protein